MKSGVIGWCIVVALVAVAGAWVGLGIAVAPDKVNSGHRFHVREMESECCDCHVTVVESASASDRNIPNHDVCFDCHDGEGAPDDCETCHTNADEAMERQLPDRELIFSHKAHTGREVTCSVCHKEAKTDDEDDLVFGMPDMATCTSCHDGRQAQSMCETCHTNVAGLRPADHTPDYSQRHADVATTDVSSCGQCHVQEQDCDVCHRGDNLRGLPHREGFITTHPFEFYSKTKDCAACHDFQVSCVSCHQSRSVMPANHSLANWRERHDGFAETDMEACAACHDDGSPTCLRCH